MYLDLNIYLYIFKSCSCDREHLTEVMLHLEVFIVSFYVQNCAEAERKRFEKMKSHTHA